MVAKGAARGSKGRGGPFQLRNADPFRFDGGLEGCLLIHGFTGSPGEVRLLGEFLHQKGYTVYGVLLAGHGTSPADLRSTTWQDWTRSAERELATMRNRCRRVYLVGFSMGGLIALHLGARHQVDGLVTLATPMRLRARGVGLLHLIQFIRDYVPNRPRRPEIAAYAEAYPLMPLRSVVQLLKLIKEVRGKLSRVSAPLLVVQGEEDRAVDPCSARVIYNGVSSGHKRLAWFAGAGHLLVLEPCRDLVFRAVVDFLREVGDKEERR